ncbi:MAG: NADH:flavin oxidoreductase [Bacteroidia bacterium]|nr:NADH:flavin oxidoreductase [Bacteroidia bacterium]
MKKLKETIQFSCGLQMKNRFMLAPLTNRQSHDDGTLGEDEYNWLTMRAKGGFGITMTCASHVQEIGKGFPGQLGIFDDKHIDGHKKLVQGIKAYNSLAVIQLHHAGMRSPKEIINQQPVCPSYNEECDARALTLDEVKTLRDDFIIAAQRAQKVGYDGIEVHGAHGYILCQFLSSDINNRTDEYGGSLENRSRILFEIVDGIRQTCGKEFLIGIRLSPERFGMDLLEVITISQQFIDEEQIDFLDISLWDCFKYPEDEAYKNKTLLEHVTSLDFKNVKLTVAGKISSGKDVHDILQSDVDFVTIGRSAILHHDFPKRVMDNKDFTAQSLPVTPEYLKNEGLSDTFIEYMDRWPDFVLKN